MLSGTKVKSISSKVVIFQLINVKMVPDCIKSKISILNSKFEVFIIMPPESPLNLLQNEISTIFLCQHGAELQAFEITKGKNV